MEDIRDLERQLDDLLIDEGYYGSKGVESNALRW